MFCKWNKRTIWLVMILLVVVGGGFTSVSFADQDGHSSINDIRDIRGTGDDGARDFTADVANQYDVIGTVDDVQEEGLVVDDSYFKITSESKIFGVRIGTRVGLVIIDDEIVLCEPFKK